MTLVWVKMERHRFWAAAPGDDDLWYHNIPGTHYFFFLSPSWLWGPSYWLQGPSRWFKALSDNSKTLPASSEPLPASFESLPHGSEALPLLDEIVIVFYRAAAQFPQFNFNKTSKSEGTADHVTLLRSLDSSVRPSVGPLLRWLVMLSSNLIK